MNSPASPSSITGRSISGAAGKLGILADEIAGNEPKGTTGIGHTRWATHGGPTMPNAHPHTDQSGKIALIHNGIIENAASIKKALWRAATSSPPRPTPKCWRIWSSAFYEGNLEEAVACGAARREWRLRHLRDLQRRTRTC
ncbi:MAG: hypothetical protein IPJ11_09735 [Gemmatimonadetes bacterium]|nr:hypothetical protein [Gemmatimonadota bacterium]